MFTNTRYLPHTSAPAILLSLLLLTGCGSENDSGQGSANDAGAQSSAPAKRGANAEALALEKETAAANDLYLIVDLPRSKFQIKMRGTLLRELPFTYAGDTLSLNELLSEAPATEIEIQKIIRVHAFSASGLLDDTTVAVVSRTTGASPELIQRRVPERIDISLSEGLIIRLRSDIEGQTLSRWGNAYEWLRQQVAEVSGTRLLDISLESKDALALYGVCFEGVPIIIYY